MGRLRHGRAGSREYNQMAILGGRRTGPLCIGSVLSIMLVAFTLSQMPSFLVTLLVLWLLLSVPLGIAVGHCALEER